MGAPRLPKHNIEDPPKKENSFGQKILQSE